MKCPCEDCFEKDPGEWNGCTGEQEECIDYRRWQIEEEAEYMRSELEAGAIKPGVYPNDFLDTEDIK